MGILFYCIDHNQVYLFVNVMVEIPIRNYEQLIHLLGKTFLVKIFKCKIRVTSKMPVNIGKTSKYLINISLFKKVHPIIECQPTILLTYIEHKRISI